MPMNWKSRFETTTFTQCDGSSWLIATSSIWYHMLEAVEARLQDWGRTCRGWRWRARRGVRRRARRARVPTRATASKPSRSSRADARWSTWSLRRPDWQPVPPLMARVRVGAEGTRSAMRFTSRSFTTRRTRCALSCASDWTPTVAASRRRRRGLDSSSRRRSRVLSRRQQRPRGRPSRAKGARHARRAHRWTTSLRPIGRTTCRPFRRTSAPPWAPTLSKWTSWASSANRAVRTAKRTRAL